jgi:hypothetical protein
MGGRSSVSFAQTQYVALGLNILLGLVAGWQAGTNPLLGPLALYVMVLPAGAVHLICSFFESAESRREWARLDPVIDFDAEEQRIANAGYPEQHRLYMENRLMRERLRRANPVRAVAPPALDVTHSDDQGRGSVPATRRTTAQPEDWRCAACGYVATEPRRRCPRCATPYD